MTNDAAASAETRKAAYAAEEEEEEVLTPEEERRRHALFQEHLGEVLAEHDKAVSEEPDKTEEWVSPIEDRDGKWVILYRTVFGTFDSEEAVEGWAMTQYPAARRWAQQLEAFFDRTEEQIDAPTPAHYTNFPNNNDWTKKPTNLLGADRRNFYKIEKWSRKAWACSGALLIAANAAASFHK